MSTNEHNNGPEYQPLIEKKNNEIVNQDIDIDFREFQNIGLSSSQTVFIIFCTIFTTLIIVLIKLFINFVLCFIFIYYKLYYEQCKAELYGKVNTILYLYLTLSIIYILQIITSLIYGFQNRHNDDINYRLQNRNNDSVLMKFLKYTIVALNLGNTLFGLVLFLVVQINYTKTTNWMDCGNFKPWTQFWLIINYLGLIISFFSFCC
jgi:hypothetical protein